MYACSDAFHQAAAANEPQIALFVFEDGVLTNEDIDVNDGIDFRDYFCTKEDISIGEALSNELNFKLMNEKRNLLEFPFGRFTALLGVRISVEVNDEGLVMDYGGHVYQGSSIAGRRLLMDGRLTASQPGFPVVALAAMDGKVYCYSEQGDTFAVTAGTGKQTTWPENAFMREKTSRWGGYTFAYENRILTIVKANGNRERYEFVPLGIFNAERPKVTDDAQLEMKCYDRMKDFDEDLDMEFSYPISAKDLLNQVCTKLDVPVAVDSFINQGATLTEKPTEFDNCTKRDVIAWIAEIAASNAKIDRDGKMTFVWLRSTKQSYDESWYTECRPYYYQTGKVDSLCSRNLSDSADTYASSGAGEGNGENIYLIQDNPFLK